MARVLVTGMSGVGKSTALVALQELGHHVVDTDWPGWSREILAEDGTLVEQLWREDRMAALLSETRDAHLFVSGCTANQVAFYDRFDAIVLLATSLEVVFGRVAARTGNPYGKSVAERAQIEEHVATVEPLLRRGATHEIDASRPLVEVVETLVEIADRAGRA